MPQRPLTDPQPCVWMNAGVIRYRLCTRDLDCDTCPLDAVLRGRFQVMSGSARDSFLVTLGGELPEDRLYSMGHTWLKARVLEPGAWRVGLDTFAAMLVGRPDRVRLEAPGRVLSRDEPFCHLELDAGTLRLALPAGGQVVRVNEGLETRPELVATSPLDGGWMADLALSDTADLQEMTPATAASSFAEEDLARFRRSLAFRLLCDPTPRAPLSHPRGRLSELCDLLGPEAYLELLREFVH